MPLQTLLPAFASLQHDLALRKHIVEAFEELVTEQLENSRNDVHHLFLTFIDHRDAVFNLKNAVAKAKKLLVRIKEEVLKQQIQKQVQRQTEMMGEGPQIVFLGLERKEMVAAVAEGGVGRKMAKKLIGGWRSGRRRRDGL